SGGSGGVAGRLTVEGFGEAADEPVSIDEDGDTQEAVLVEKVSVDVGLGQGARQVEHLGAGLDPRLAGAAGEGERLSAVEAVVLGIAHLDGESARREKLSRQGAGGSATAAVEDHRARPSA